MKKQVSAAFRIFLLGAGRGMNFCCLMMCYDVRSDRSDVKLLTQVRPEEFEEPASEGQS